MMIKETCCPVCNKQHFRYSGSATTLLGWYPTYKDGELINSDPNIRTDYFKCLECDADFYTKEQYGKIIEVVPKYSSKAIADKVDIGIMGVLDKNEV